MKLITRLSLVVAGAVALVPGVSAWAEVREERQLLADASVDDRYFVGTTLQAFLHARILDDLGEAADRIEHATELPDTQISIVGLGQVDESLVGATHQDHHTLEAGKVLVRAEGQRMRTIVPVPNDPEHRAFVIDEPRETHAAIAEAAVRGAMATGAGLTVVAGLFAVFAWMLLVVRPAARLARLADRIAGGDLSARTELERMGPITALAEGMNTMAARLDDAQRALASAASERTLLLEELRHADRLRTVGQIAAALAHELGTPLNTVSGHARLVERSAAADDAVRSSARVIAEQTKRMATLVRDLLDYGRRTKTERRAERPRALIDEAVEMLTPLAQKRRISLRVDAAACPAILVDRAQVLQVLTNVIVNGLHASADGGAIDIVLCGEQAARHDGERRRSMVRISISDHGRGIAPEDLPRIFDPFFTNKAPGDGTGLGLPIARGIVEEHDGWMTVASRPGEGSTFSIFLPAN